ncbi:hypothetical protein BN1723_012858 [Verticillium longisporum]|uniref:Uncharacterized protein n=1 Tax=Verticillium longisporum TaxID=100787 RepID=A0A0G4LLY7_VERLO|nr:hypothetical protein HYQ44_001590 [Verticillium longisporum]KAG7147663.1 hypothetical protein HYQ46_003486 [Verticillium longisporum]CRK17434.1 hypothetical protein BN1708_012042 [Verticillium longisporum]CRK23003.1 hypothetical protein BN1723_012858 [Verticillium longisporum]
MKACVIATLVGAAMSAPAMRTSMDMKPAAPMMEMANSQPMDMDMGSSTPAMRNTMNMKGASPSMGMAKRERMEMGNMAPAMKNTKGMKMGSMAPAMKSGMATRSTMDMDMANRHSATKGMEMNKDVDTIVAAMLMEMAHRRPVAGMVRRQSEEAFQEVVEECKTKLASGEVTSLDNCVLDTLGINRRQVTGDQEQLAKITQECNDKTPNNQAAIYVCLLQAAQDLIITDGGQ